MLQLVLRERRIIRGVVERATGTHFLTRVELVKKDDIEGILKKNGWRFNWRKEYINHNRKVFKLLVEGSPEIQCLISIEIIPGERYLELHLIENALPNQSPHKKFIGVARNLVAYICKMSFEMGFDGVVAFTAKTKLIQHYIDNFRAILIFNNNRMMIYPWDAKRLVDSYFKTSTNEEE